MNAVPPTFVIAVVVRDCWPNMTISEGVLAATSCLLVLLVVIPHHRFMLVRRELLYPLLALTALMLI